MKDSMIVETRMDCIPVLEKQFCNNPTMIKHSSDTTLIGVRNNN
jgi:hypothetical protein